MTHKAKLGFTVYSLDDELQVPDEKDFERNEAEQEYARAEASKARKLRCYHKHKENYNKAKRAVAARIEGRFKAAKQGARKRGVGWEFTPEEWERAWQEAGWIRVPGSQSEANPQGDIVPAFALRGAHRYNNTCMQRLDLGKPWGPSNYRVMFRGQEVGPDNKWSVSSSEINSN
jgi:hypothetical protein